MGTWAPLDFAGHVVGIVYRSFSYDTNVVDDTLCASAYVCDATSAEADNPCSGTSATKHTVAIERMRQLGLAN